MVGSRSKITDMIQEGLQVAPAYLFWIFDPQRSRSCIPGIGQRRKMLLGQLLIVFGKIALIHQHLPPDLDQLNAVPGKSSTQGNGTDLPDIGRDLVTGNTIPPRNPS